ncbi:MAG TPA: hypothetical protein VLC95_04495, partial [Anaerolineae bacterium]|nr:hypothetical protein [Anaerolineae bacterium]
MHSFTLRAALIALALLAFLVAAPAATAQGSGVLEGQVVNGTQGGPAIGSGVNVTLRAFQNGIELNVQQAATGDDGRFRFEGLDTDSALEYWLEADYLDVNYAEQEPYAFAEGEETLSATVSVYETTTDDSTVRIGSVHMIAESFGQAMRVTEIHLLSNSGDRTFVGEPGEGDTPFTVSIPLPDGAVGFALGEGMAADRFVEVEGGLSDTDPVPPGQETSMVFFSYHLMVTGDAVELEREFSYPVDILNILVAQPGLELESEQLESRGAQLFQGRQYGFFAATDLPAGSPVVMNLLPVAGADTAPSMPGAEPAPSASAGGPSDSTQVALRWIGLALSLVAVVAAFVYP